MKKVLLGSTVLLMSAGVAAADVAVGGDGRLGVVYGKDKGKSGEFGFNSRVRIAFSASGETDGGVAFGGSIRADNAVGGAKGTAGSVFISSSFGKLTMGDTNGAAEAAVGDVSGVGYTGLSDLNEGIYLSNNTNPNATDFDGSPLLGTRPVARYEYAFSSGAVYASVGNPAGKFTADADETDEDVIALDGGDIKSYSVGASFTFSNITAALGYESLESSGNGADSLKTNHTVAGLSAAFGNFTGKFTYGSASKDIKLKQYGLSGDYVIGATTLTAFYRVVDSTDANTGLGIDDRYIGLGAAYDLGGGATLAAGYVKADDKTVSDSDFDQFDLGIKFTF